MQNSDQLRLNPPSLPAGGGAISGLKGNIAAAGPDGAATLTIPLPVSAGRGYAPSLSLGYHSRAGNGPFGIGWHITLPSIRRRANKGAPVYDDHDEFIGPDGEVLVPVLNTGGQPQRSISSELLGIPLPGSYNVSVWRPRVESSFSRLERWLPAVAEDGEFWVVYSADGQVHLLGKNNQARISHPMDATKIAVWLSESSVSAYGEQIYYQYRAEDDTDCDAAEISAHPKAFEQRYLVAVHYGNLVAERSLPGLGSADPLEAGWLFSLVADYGERATGEDTAPVWQAAATWPCRPDIVSGYEFGFALRTRRLCRQLLMFHRLDTLAGKAKGEDIPALVARLLLEYDENPSISTLRSARQMAYEPDGARCALPPLTFSWQTFTPPMAQWQPRDDLGNLNPWQPWQFTDLNGEGLPGVLYQDDGAWWYRAPVRQADGDADAVTWGTATPLPVVPVLQGSGTLTDLNGDGRMEWVVTAPGVAGRYDRTPEGGWLNFTPLSALPVEYTHPRAQLADILGAGLSDMVLIGPRSVRLYAGREGGWEKSETVVQSDGVALPIPGADARVLVAFSDLPGSGQQHLVQVRADGVTYWPNLGHGRFGHPVAVPGFSQPAVNFNPDQLYLADVDGSGTTDLIYAQSDHLLVFLNQSGNRFAEPFSIPMPTGVRFDRTCRLLVADIQGLGVASLVLVVPHPAVRHWLLPLAPAKPWLLGGMNNNMGAQHNLLYRSSAQFWLDEKAEKTTLGEPVPVSYLPFALHTLWRSEIEDEITGNRLVSEMSYRHGAWDGREREFRGFGYVQVQDTDALVARGTAGDIAPPGLNCSWFATGLPEVDSMLPQEYWQGDSAAFTGFAARFTIGDGEEEQTITPDEESGFWLRRALRGMPLRGEVYGVDDSWQTNVPYSVSEGRPQARLVQTGGAYPVVWASVVESRSYLYERVSSDPQCSQSILLTSDGLGKPLKEVAVNYPRRAQPPVSPWPDTLPDTLFSSSFDEQQLTLRLTLQQSSWHNLSAEDNSLWAAGLPDASRSDIFTYPASSVPKGGVTIETLLRKDGLVAETQDRTFAGQLQIWYLDSNGEETTEAPGLPARVSFKETAVLDDGMESALAESGITEQQLKAAGWELKDRLFARSGEPPVWGERSGYTTYASAERFWQPITFQTTALTGKVIITRDACDCVVTQYQDAAGLTTRAEYDWRFLKPVQVKDSNDNIHSVILDALGRVTATRFKGTENGEITGYSDVPLMLPDTADGLLALSVPLPVAKCVVWFAESWMSPPDDGGVKLPPHVITLSTDNYDGAPSQQIREQVAFSDGFGLQLQVAVRHSPGGAWQRDRTGSLITGENNLPKEITTNDRWAVTGRTEYNNKGQPIRTYQPYFLNDWRYVSDDSARHDLYADTHYYDPIGREWQVETAKGWLRRSLFTPWFVVSEDENDTAQGSDPEV